MSSSFAPECTESKKVYDDCFSKWYTEQFLQGKSNMNECTEEWDTYQACFSKALSRHGIKARLEKAEEESPFKNGGVPIDSDLQKK